MPEHGMIAWSELMTTEVEKAKDFYGRSLGLTFDSFDPTGGGKYWVAMADGKPAWGIMDMNERPGGPSGWFTYIAVDEVDARVKGAIAGGAQLCMPIFDIPTVGRIAILVDPTGALIGWMTPSEQG
ncbi:VOC family protein [Aestuariivirga sp.]|uniref:VOC family protein n=1 Tax=Aestuariivirga sp. TaxID=2650926 RepID=UPI003593FB51